MAKFKIKVLANQSIWDLAAQYYGSVNGVKQLILDNPDKIDFNTSPIVNTELIIDDAFVLNKKMVEFFGTEVIKPATSYIASNWILATGIWNDAGAWDDAANWID